MRAVTLDSFGSRPRLRYDLPEPGPSNNELLVRVHASSVNPSDAKIAAGDLKWMFRHDFPVTLGRDFAGVVEQAGNGVSSYQAGDEVYGFLLHANPTVHKGSWTELITVPEGNFVAAKPRNLDMPSAGAAPLAAIAALAACDALAPTRNEAVLVIGATGGIGSFFVQLAAGAGAHVIASAFPEDEEYLRDLGAAEILDRNADLHTTLRDRHADGVDAILDLVSSTPHDALLKKGGRLASPIGAAGEGRRRFNLIFPPAPGYLERVADLLDTGTLRVPIQKSYGLSEAPEALRAFADSHTQGKLSISA